MAARLCVSSLCRVLRGPLTRQRLPTQVRSFAVYYTEDHEWLDVSGNKARIGITDHAQDALGDIVYIDLPEIGLEVEVGDEFCSVESVKAVGEVIAPIDGVVTGVNDILSERPDLVNSSPEKDGWITEIELSDPSQVEGLMDRDSYDTFLKE